jgi:hypothetical protein
VSFSLFGQNFRFVLGGLSRCSTVPYPVQGWQVIITSEKTLKGVLFVQTSLTTTLSRKTEVFSFRFLRQSVLLIIYLGQEPVPLDASRPRVILHLAGDAHDAQDLLDQLSRMAWRVYSSSECCACILLLRVLRVHTKRRVSSAEWCECIKANNFCEKYCPCGGALGATPLTLLPLLVQILTCVRRRARCSVY